MFLAYLYVSLATPCYNDLVDPLQSASHLVGESDINIHQPTWASSAWGKGLGPWQSQDPGIEMMFYNLWWNHVKSPWKSTYGNVPLQPTKAEDLQISTTCRSDRLKWASHKQTGWKTMHQPDPKPSQTVCETIEMPRSVAGDACCGTPKIRLTLVSLKSQVLKDLQSNIKSIPSISHIYHVNSCYAC